MKRETGVSIAVIDWMNNLALQYGYFGVFIVSIIGTMAIIIPIPYTLVILGLGAAGWDPLLLTIAGGLGSATGEFVGYLLGYYGRRIVSEERQRKMDYLLKLFGKYSYVAIFFFALTPLPDDLLFIPLGILRYNPIKAFFPAVLGKSLMCYMLASFGGVYRDVLILLFGGEGGWIGGIITGALLIVVILALYRVDWEKVFAKYVVNRGKVENNRRAYKTAISL
ncbi:MAG: YqaA family protein [Candidatus Bathyarchaeia archaeon]